MRHFFLCLVLCCVTVSFLRADTPEESSVPNLVYRFDVKEEIGSAVWRKMQKAMKEAKNVEPKYFLIYMNTYGGELSVADSMRSALLRFPIPSIVFIDNNAASAGALISLACDSIYMTEGATIGAATVVNGADGKAMPDKYQSYMRAMMRATAESHGVDTIYEGGTQKIRFFRDPRIAEAMVDDRIVIPNVVDSGKTLTLTTNEALKYGFCEGKAKSVNEVLGYIKMQNAEVITYQPDFIQQIIGFLVNPFLQSILLMIIIGGIWFELQSPGVGFPILAAGIAATLYFTPLLLEGIATYWELALFAVGILLLVLEFFVIPGFGVAGILGAVCAFVGLVLALVGTLDFDLNPENTYKVLSLAVFQVLVSILLLIILAFVFGGVIFKAKLFRRVALAKTMTIEEGFSIRNRQYESLLGQEGIVANDLRPSGSVEIAGEVFDAVAIVGFIAKGKKIKVIKTSVGQLYVEQLD